MTEYEKQLRTLPADWGELNKVQLAFARLPDEWVYDTALPQQWLDEQAGDDTDKYLHIMSRTVWIYPPGAGVIGMACDLVEGRIYQ